MDLSELSSLRRSYQLAGLDAAKVDPDPLNQFTRWLQDALSAGLVEPNAMTLATADSHGRPRARTVLLKGADQQGFTFFTNYGSTKASHLAENPQASLCFPWIGLERQVMVSGSVEKVSSQESAEYFRSRPHGSQLGAVVSRQSSVIAARSELDDRYTALEREFPEGTQVPVPDFWGGYRLRPREFEFWQGRGNRLHDRIRYRLDSAGEWRIERLAP